MRHLSFCPSLPLSLRVAWRDARSLASNLQRPHQRFSFRGDIISADDRSLPTPPPIASGRDVRIRPRFDEISRHFVPRSQFPSVFVVSPRRPRRAAIRLDHINTSRHGTDILVVTFHFIVGHGHGRHFNVFPPETPLPDNLQFAEEGAAFFNRRSTRPPPPPHSAAVATSSLLVSVV